MLSRARRRLVEDAARRGVRVLPEEGRVILEKGARGEGGSVSDAPFGPAAHPEHTAADHRRGHETAPDGHVGVAPVVVLPPMPPRTPPMTVKAWGLVSVLPSQVTVTSYGPGRALLLTVAVPLALSLGPETGDRCVVGNALELAVPPLRQPSTVMVSWPPRAITLGRTVMLLGLSHATAAGAERPRAATAAPATARARVLRM
jgi:hypothetical protein